jgi:hypothetical protein
MCIVHCAPSVPATHAGEVQGPLEHDPGDVVGQGLDVLGQRRAALLRADRPDHGAGKLGLKSAVGSPLTSCSIASKGRKQGCPLLPTRNEISTVSSGRTVWPKMLAHASRPTVICRASAIGIPSCHDDHGFPSTHSCLATGSVQESRRRGVLGHIQTPTSARRRQSQCYSPRHTLPHLRLPEMPTSAYRPTENTSTLTLAPGMGISSVCNQGPPVTAPWQVSSNVDSSTRG